MMHTDNAGEGTPQVAQMSGDEVEGRLSAHRYILSHLLAKLATDPEKRKVLLDWLDERACVHDNEEDPGAVIMEAFAEQQARADEFKIILRTYAGWLNWTADDNRLRRTKILFYQKKTDSHQGAQCPAQDGEYFPPLMAFTPEPDFRNLPFQKSNGRCEHATNSQGAFMNSRV